MKQSPEKLWTIEDVAEFCRVKPSVIRYWLRNTDIPHIRLGKHIRFEPEKVKGWVGSKNCLPYYRIKSILKHIK